MSDIITNPIKCPNCDTDMSMDEDCTHCGYNDVHDRDTKEIARLVLICGIQVCGVELEAGNTKTIVIGDQKRKVCNNCEDLYYAHLDLQRGKGKV